MANNAILFGFSFSLIFFIIIGVLSSLKKKPSTKDYLLADQGISPWLTALSAVATTNSGFMFVAMIAFTYKSGLSSIWLAVGWVAGDFLISFLAYPKIRKETERTESLSYTELLGKWGDHNFTNVRKIAALITVIFLCIYAAAQLKAGGKALHVLLGWDVNVGAFVGSGIVFIYCYAGGIRASIWTDAAQSFVMIFSMALLLFVGIQDLGGLETTLVKFQDVSPSYLSIFPESISKNNLVLGLAFYIVSWLFGGFIVAGQPHIMTRFMTISDPKYMTRVRWYYYSWYLAFYFLTIGVGMLSRVYLSDGLTFDAELALPYVAIKLLPGVLVGFVLSGLFAATMSTADSQILSCTASVSRDLFQGRNISLGSTKKITLFICCVSLLISLCVPASVFSLVLFAWSGLGCAFTPLLLVHIFKGQINERQAMLMMFVGLLTAIIWRAVGLNGILYEGCPGVLLSLSSYFIMRQIGKKQETSH